MVKLTKEGYTPVLDSASKSFESKIEQASNQASGLVDATLRNVDKTQNQAARDRAEANETAFRQRIGLAGYYQATSDAYLATTKKLYDIDEAHKTYIRDKEAKAYNLQAREKIELATIQFYEEAKQKNPLGMVEDVQDFINNQIEQAVKAAPSDKAVQDLYAQMSVYKVDALGTAIKDRQVVREKQINAAIGEAQNVAVAHIRMNPSDEQFQETLSRFSTYESILTSRGFSKDQIDSVKQRYEQDITESRINGLLDQGLVDEAKVEMSKDENIQRLGNKFDKVWADGVKMAKEKTQEALKASNKAAVVAEYEKGKSVVGLEGHDAVVQDLNKEFLSKMESLDDPANGSTVAFQYFKDRNSYMSKGTIDYMVNNMMLGDDAKKTALYAGTLSKMSSDPSTAPMLAKLSEDQKITVSNMMYYLEHTKSPQKALEITRAVNLKMEQYNGINNESFTKTTVDKLKDRFGASDNLTLGKKTWRELESDGYFLGNSLVGRLFGVKPDEQSLKELGNMYSETYSKTLAATGNEELAHKNATLRIKSSGDITEINGYWQVMKSSPSKLGILSTREGKEHFEEQLLKGKQKVAESMGGFINGRGYLQIGNKEAPIDIEPIPYVTGYETDGTVRYMLVQRDSKIPFTINGKEAGLIIDTLPAIKQIEDKAKLRREQEAEILENEIGAWDKIKNNRAQVLPGLILADSTGGA